jgi:DNA-binding CsgD family transcriptional regulator/pimeloyl-ACP methyl ester carboxylesterase
MDAPPVQYVRTSDGYDIAYCVSGSGTGFVHVPFPFNHIQLFWRPDSAWLPWFVELRRRFRLVQYDFRGAGMSSRGLDADAYTMDRVYADLEQVIEASGIDRFVLFGVGPNVELARRYAVENPGRLLALVLIAPVIQAAPRGLTVDLARQDWELFLATLAGGGAELTREQRAADIEVMRRIYTQHDYVTMTELYYQNLERPEKMKWTLSNIKVPTLVLHPRDFRLVRPESSQDVAASIPGAMLVLVDGSSITGEVAQTVAAIDDFLASLAINEGQSLSISSAAGLSPREVEVLRLLAAGKSNREIADALVLSVNTVIRHVSNIYAKTGAANRAEATAFAAKQGLI